MAKQTQLWEDTKADVTTFDWKGKPLCLKNIPAIKNKRTGIICFEPSDIAKAEMSLYAEKNGITERDIPILLMLLAKPGIFQEGEVPYKYHLNKMLFYQQENMKKIGLGETYVHDNFVADVRGPVPTNLGDDLHTLEKEGFLSLHYKKWGKGGKEASLSIALTPKGEKVAINLANAVQEPLKQITIAVKQDLFPLDPKQICEKVHKEYPQFRKYYTEIDKE